MTEDQVVSLLVQGGIGATALAMLGKITLKVADRMIGAIDALSKEARDTGKATVEALSSLTERLSRLEGKVEVLSADWPQEQAIHRERTRPPAAEELVGTSPVTRRR